MTTQIRIGEALRSRPRVRRAGPTNFPWQVRLHWRSEQASRRYNFRTHADALRWLCGVLREEPQR